MRIHSEEMYVKKKISVCDCISILVNIFLLQIRFWKKSSSKEDWLAHLLTIMEEQLIIQTTLFKGHPMPIGTVDKTLRPKAAYLSLFRIWSGIHSKPPSLRVASLSVLDPTNIVARTAIGAAPPNGNSSAPTMKIAMKTRLGPSCAKTCRESASKGRRKANIAPWMKVSRSSSNAWGLAFLWKEKASYFYGFFCHLKKVRHCTCILYISYNYFIWMIHTTRFL